MGQADQIDLIVAIIALIASLSTAVITAFFTKRNEIRLKHIENDLAVKKAEQDARRDYEYEARKRLYQECEPILFEFSELSESALRRIYALTRNAKEGNLGPNRYWLSTDHYFIRSTIYRLMAPLAAFKLLQRKLTSIDLKLDQSINIQYILAKILYYTFSSSPDLAKANPAIPYDPDQIGSESQGLNEPDKKQMREKYPEKFWLQGLKVGNLDMLSEALIFENGNETHIKSFGEFEQEFLKSEGADSLKNKFEGSITIFSYFHPKTRPILWRTLITQAYLYKAILNIRNNENFYIAEFNNFKKFFEIEKTKTLCDWKQYDEEISDEEFDASFRAAEEFIKNRLQDVYDFKQLKI